MAWLDLAPLPLTAAAFAPFGKVVGPDDQATTAATGRAVNAGTAHRFDLPGHLAHRTASPLPSLALYRCQPQPQPVPVPLLERHKLTSQTFFPLRVTRWVVVTAPEAPDGGPDPLAARAFLACAAQGVSYAPGIWHSPLIALDAPADFAMLMWETGGVADCETVTLARPLRIPL